MAENEEGQSREDLSDEASPYRIEEYRRKGMVAQSREVSGMAALLAAGITTYAYSPQIGTQIGEFMKEVFRVDIATRMNFSQNGILQTVMMKALVLAISAGLPICAAGFVFGIIASFAQVGSIFTVEPLMPDFSKVDPLKGLQRLFSTRQVVDGLRLFTKMIIVVTTAYFLVKTDVFEATRHVWTEPAALLGVMAGSSKSIFFSLCAVLSLFAGIDFAFQRFEYGKKVRLTKQEAKQEHKEREGDPQIKARIRMVQRDMARKRMMQAVKKADVIVTNPTHIAIAIVYDKEKMAAPKVVAKGADFLAQRIKQIASDAGVPMVENVPLARTLFKTVKVGQAVPRALYQAVAEVLAFVYRLKKRGI